MNNPLMGGMPKVSGPMGDIQQLMQQFNEFRQTIKGNPQQQVQQLLNTGKISQSDYNYAYQQAVEAQKQMQQFQQMMGGK